MAEKSTVLVAIPKEDDPVWKISSEKVPHMTLLYLDSHIDNLARAEEYIQHVVDTVLCRFYLSVNRRGTLGDKSADVLFFDEYGQKKLRDLRTYVLQNKDIRTAYDSVEQYEGWVAHLTLGYPETPAKPDTREYPGIGSVCFDRLALWTDDYEGMEFPLKTDEYEEYTHSMELGKDVLEHHGVKGMKWGVIRDKIRNRPDHSSEDARAAKAHKKTVRKHGTKALSNEELQALVRRMNLESQFADLRKKQPSKFKTGHETVKNILEVAKTGQQVAQLAKGPAGKAGAMIIKNALKK